MMEILNRLRKVGVHSVISHEQIILEILEEKLEKVDRIDGLINDLLKNIENSNFKKVSLECPRIHFEQLNRTTEKMKIRGERVIYNRSLRDPINLGEYEYELWSITEEKSVLFLADVMDRKFEDTEKFIMSMIAELPLQVQRMFTVYIVNNEPVGVVFPHLEPNKEKEGRIFWIGIHPNYRGKGLGKNLHLIGLYRLQNDFKAYSYLGATQINNNPMRKIMKYNGCVENKNKFISLEYSS